MKAPRPSPPEVRLHQAPEAATPAQAPGAFQVEVRSRGPVQVIVADGEFDLAAAPVMWDCVGGACNSDTERIEIDLRGLSFIDSTGVNVLLKARELCADRGVEFAITGESPAVRRLFDVAGLTSLLEPRDGRA